MSGASSSGAAWSSRLEPIHRAEDVFGRPDDPRLGDVIEAWQGEPAALRPGRAVLVGFPQDDGVSRNHGRPGAAEAPREIRLWLHRLTPWDGARGINLADNPPLDAGDVRRAGTLEEAQEALGEVVGAILQAGAVPVVLGGGHETAYGHYLGYVAAGLPVGIINVDAHLDVRPCPDGHGHSGSPFRQALEHVTHPLPGDRYVCLGAQPHAVSRQHDEYSRQQGCVVRWCSELQPSLAHHLGEQRDRLAAAGCRVYVTLDADAVRMADVPGVSAPNPAGLSGQEVIAAAHLAGCSSEVASLDLVEINPRHDRDGQSARWAALVIWNFLVGLQARQPITPRATPPASAR
jgi:formiminoglutamase